MSHPPPITDAFLARLLAEFTTAETTGVLLTGSHARGDATEFSDVDLVRYVSTLPERDEARYTLAWREGRLISLSSAPRSRASGASWRGLKPRSGPCRDCARRASCSTAMARWPRSGRSPRFPLGTVAGAADAYASYELMGLAEEAHKALAGLAGGDETLALYGTYGLVFGLARAVAVQRGVLIRTENVFFRQVQEAVGVASAWAAAFRQAAGFEVATPLERAAAGLRLYRETATLFAPIVQPAHRPVIEATLTRIRDAGLL